MYFVSRADTVFNHKEDQITYYEDNVADWEAQGRKELKLGDMGMELFFGLMPKAESFVTGTFKGAS